MKTQIIQDISAMGGGSLLTAIVNWAVVRGRGRQSRQAKLEELVSRTVQELIGNLRQDCADARKDAGEAKAAAAQCEMKHASCERELAAVRAEIAKWAPTDPLPPYEPQSRPKRTRKAAP